MEPADPDFYRIGYVRSVRAYGIDFMEGPDGFGVYATRDVEPLRRARVSHFNVTNDLFSWLGDNATSDFCLYEIWKPSALIWWSCSFVQGLFWYFICFMFRFQKLKMKNELD